MAVTVDDWDNVCELYPKSNSACKEMAILKREIILHYMNTGLEMSYFRRKTGIPSALDLGRNEGSPP